MYLLHLLTVELTRYGKQDNDGGHDHLEGHGRCPCLHLFREERVGNAAKASNSVRWHFAARKQNRFLLVLFDFVEVLLSDELANGQVNAALVRERLNAFLHIRKIPSGAVL